MPRFYHKPSLTQLAFSPDAPFGVFSHRPFLSGRRDWRLGRHQLISIRVAVYRRERN